MAKAIKKYNNNMKNIFKKTRQALSYMANMDDVVRYNLQRSLEEHKAATVREMNVLQMQNQNFTSMEMGVTDEKYCTSNVIVSLTSHSVRIYEAYIAIESIMRQTVKPNKIILWLAEDEFTRENLPETLKRLQRRGLDVDFYKDIKSYKKLIPSLKKYPDDIIITVDDDIIYQYDLIENLLNSYRQNPEMIHFCWGYKIKFKQDGTVDTYRNWGRIIENGSVDRLNFAHTGSALFPPHSLHAEVANESAFMSLSPHSDEVWIYAMSVMQGTLMKKAFTHHANGMDYIKLTDEIQTKTTLWNYNRTGGKDEQIKNVFQTYDIYDLIK